MSLDEGIATQGVRIYSLGILVYNTSEKFGKSEGNDLDQCSPNPYKAVCQGGQQYLTPDLKPLSPSD